MSDQNEAGASEDVMDESLGRLAATGPEFRGGLSNHGPMATEAMIRLGRADAIEPWLDGYIQRLESAPRATDVIAGQTWRDAEQPWRQVLARWWPRLVPGLAAAAPE